METVNDPYLLSSILSFLQQQFDSSKPNWTLRIVSDANLVRHVFCLGHCDEKAKEKIVGR